MRIAMILSFCSASLFAIDGWLPHLTGPEGKFDTKIIIHNPSLNSAEVVFHAGELGRTPVKVGPNSTYRLSAEQTKGFPGFVKYESPSDLVEVGVEFGGPQSYAPGLQGPQRFYGYKFPAEAYWVGFAIVNLGSAPADVFVERPSLDSGETEMFAEQLEPYQKYLRGIASSNSFSSEVANKFLREVNVTSDQPILCLAIYLTPNGMRYQAAKQTWDQHIEIHITGGFAGINERVRIEPGKITFQERSVELQERDAFVESLFSRNLEGITIERRGQTCCDFFEYNLTFVDGARRNHFQFNGDDLAKDTQIQEIHDLIREIMLYAEEKTGLNSLPF